MNEFLFCVNTRAYFIGSKNIEWTVKDCEWSEWQLGECSKSCDGGIRTNTRTKTIEEVNGGVCEGGEITEETCNTESCPGELMFLNNIDKLQNIIKF